LRAALGRGARHAADYRKWIGAVADGIGSGQAIVVLEPDSLTVTDCLSPAALEARYALLREAVDVFASHAGVRLYLDGGHPGALPEEAMAERLEAAGVARARGFALNVSNFERTARNIKYGERLSKLLGGKGYVIDTSRNGNGSSGDWCNPFGRALGEEPSLSTGLEHGDGFLWVKRPGESDGTCHGGPAAGQFWGGYALELARAAWEPELQTVADEGATRRR
jgi:endoglucanase